MRRDIISAYLASGAKIASWVIISAIIYRLGGAAQFGILALVRGTVGILNYLALGLGPATVRMFAQLVARPQEAHIEPEQGAILSYPFAEAAGPLRILYSCATTLAFRCSIIAGVGCIVYAMSFGWTYENVVLARQGGTAIFLIGSGLLIRLISEPSGAVLQATGRISTDNGLQSVAELIWAGATAILLLIVELHRAPLLAAAIAYAIAAIWLLFTRLMQAEAIAGRPFWNSDRSIFRELLRSGGLITLAQLADYLYAPTDYILINWFWDAAQVATYAPAVQIDAGLLVLVSGLAGVLFPHSAIAHALGDVGAVRRYYIRGTLASAAILASAAALAWLAAPMIFRLWLGKPMQSTQEILPLVLIHTVIGGSSMVGRSILLGIGRIKPFTISVLIAGVTNVVLSYVFVKYFGWGLKGIVLGTIVAVVARCLVWMPWYVMRSLNEVKELRVQPMATPEV